ncbi:hypothetical protein GA0061100_104360 [Rhizobium hainanense]|uniref:Uncharacterized protein n=1 Tax=Rhizobium hainanense TaxID=52131 RepID=A0A1C3V5C8_9HYPH|nr:hypothetical protein GA0061100_104360 [Rhizobium hainanense]
MKPIRLDCLALPDDIDGPSQCSQLCYIFLIALDIPLELRKPKFNIGFWNGGFSTAVPVPEASMHKYHPATRAHHYIRASRQAFLVKSVPDSHLVESLSYFHLWQCILTLYLRHNRRALRLGHMVHVSYSPVCAKRVCLINRKT